jgi:hypothetical protein
MSIVEVEISVSVDGFITWPTDYPGLGRGGEILHAWFRQDPEGPDLRDDALFATSGAVVTSRKTHDGADGWGEDGFYQIPVFVLTPGPTTRWSRARPLSPSSPTASRPRSHKPPGRRRSTLWAAPA